MARLQAEAAAKSSPLYIKSICAVVSPAIFVVLAELALNLANPNLYYSNQLFTVNWDVMYPKLYKKDPKLFWRLRENVVAESKVFGALTYRINSSGMRGPEIDQQERGFRIIAIGNSCTFGWGIAYENTWVYRLQGILKREFLGYHIEIINAGVPGYTSHQGKVYLEEELLLLDPDMVLIMFGWNDHWKAGFDVPDAQQQMPHRLVLEMQNLFSRSKLYRLLRKIVLSLTEKKKPAPLDPDDVSGERRVPKQEFENNLRSIVQLARQNDIIPVLLNPPIPSLKGYYGATESTLHLLHEIYQTRVIRVAKSEQVPMVNLQSVFDQYNDLFDQPYEDPVHFNVKGQAVAAVAVGSTITGLIKAQLTAGSDATYPLQER